MSVTGLAWNPNTNVTGQFICLAAADALQFTVPTEVTRSLPATIDVLGFPTGFLTLAVITNPVEFAATGLGLGNAVGVINDSKQLAFE